VGVRWRGGDGVVIRVLLGAAVVACSRAQDNARALSLPSLARVAVPSSSLTHPTISIIVQRRRWLEVAVGHLGHYRVVVGALWCRWVVVGV
jgi:hypothetical protein